MSSLLRLDRPFDFEKHRQQAIEAYRIVLPQYEDFVESMKKLLKDVLADMSIKVVSVDGRAKTVTSFGQKVVEPDSKDPNRPKYNHPLIEIKDLAALRIISFLLKTVEDVDTIIHDNFHVHRRTDKADILKEEERFGYQSVHYIVELDKKRISLPEYRRFDGMIAEIQVRTILQHAWAEIEHDIQYKSVDTIPVPYRRRFLTLAGLVELADRELDALQNEDEARQEAAHILVGQLAIE